MQTISYKPSANKMEFSGNIVADANQFETANGKGVSFRLAHNQGRDEEPVFMDVAEKTVSSPSTSSRKVTTSR